MSAADDYPLDERGVLQHEQMCAEIDRLRLAARASWVEGDITAINRVANPGVWSASGMAYDWMVEIKFSSMPPFLATAKRARLVIS